MKMSHRSPSWKRTLLTIAAVFALNISLSTVLTSMNTLSVDNLGGLSDASDYVRLYYGEHVENQRRYRMGTIWLAQLVPDSIERLLRREPTRFVRAHIHFALVNLFFLTSAGVVFFIYLSHFFETPWLSLLGVTMFLTSRVVLQQGGAPMVDPSAFLFLLLGALAILKDRPWLLVGSFAVGLVMKETALFLWPLLWLSELSFRRKRLYSVWLLPATILYLSYRFVIDPISEDTFFNLSLAGQAFSQIRSMLTPNGVLDWFSSFGLFWFPALYAIVFSEKPTVLKSWLWLIVILALSVIFLWGNPARSLFLAFPVVIPVALIGIRDWVEASRHGSADQRPVS